MEKRQYNGMGKMLAGGESFERSKKISKIYKKMKFVLA